MNATHSCWEKPDWNGLLAPEGECAGCDEAAMHPCQWCGYGHVFTTHSDLAHEENGDPALPPEVIANDERPLDVWSDTPHHGRPCEGCAPEFEGMPPNCSRDVTARVNEIARRETG